MLWLSAIVQAVAADDGKAKVLNDDTVSPGLIGSLVVLILGIAVFFLLRSFWKHVHRVPFDEPDEPDAP